MGSAVTTTPTRHELEQLRYERELRQRSIAREYQSRADAAFAPWGTRAKARVEGEDVEDYRRNLAVQAKRMLPYSDDKPSPDSTATFADLRRLKLWRMPADVFANYEPLIYAACARAVTRDDTVPEGELRAVTTTDANGLRETKFYGRQSFVVDPQYGHRAGRQIVKFRTSDGAPGWW